MKKDNVIAALLYQKYTEPFALVPAPFHCTLAGIQEPPGTGKVTIAVPHQEQTSPGNQGRPGGLSSPTEKRVDTSQLSTSGLITSGSLPSVGTDQFTPGPQAVTPSTRTPVVEQAWTTSSFPTQGTFARLRLFEERFCLENATNHLQMLEESNYFNVEHLPHKAKD